MAACPTKAQLNAIVTSLLELHAQETSPKTKARRSPEAMRTAFQRAVKEAYELGHAEHKEAKDMVVVDVDPEPAPAPEPDPVRPHTQGEAT